MCCSDCILYKHNTIYCTASHWLQQASQEETQDGKDRGKQKEVDKDGDRETNSHFGKRLKSTSTSSYHLSPPAMAPMPSFSTHNQSPGSAPYKMAFEQEGGDNLSASFKSLYKSIFGHSVSSGEYLNPPPLPQSTSAELSSSDTSLPLGASALSLLNSPVGNYSPHFYSLMDSFRDIAENNSWDKLEPAQVQGLMESFKAAERDRFGLDQETYSRVSSSFSQFFQQLNSRFITGEEGSNPTLAEYHPLPGRERGGMIHPALVNRLPPTYGQQPDTTSPFPVSGTSPPGSNYCPPNRTPSPHVSPQGHLGTSPIHPQLSAAHFHTSATHFNTFSNPFPGPDTGLGSIVPHSGTANMPIKSAATDLFENDDDDDFDWSKLM